MIYIHSNVIMSEVSLSLFSAITLNGDSIPIHSMEHAQINFVQNVERSNC